MVLLKCNSMKRTVKIITSVKLSLLIFFSPLYFVAKFFSKNTQKQTSTQIKINLQSF